MNNQNAHNSAQMSYPAARITETANQMITNANHSLEQHNTAWAQIQSYVQSFPGFMQGPIMAVLTPYERRVRASYQWQLDCAHTLLSGLGHMQQTDTTASNNFKARGFGRG
jgi:hypothetical protein